MKRANNHYIRTTERARAITAKKKATAKKHRLIVGVAALSLVLIAAASAVIVGFANNKAMPVADNNITKTVSTSAAAAPAQQENATGAIAQTIESAQDDSDSYNYNNEYAYTQAYDDSDDDQTAAPAENNDADSQDKIEIVNGERIYIDTKRTAPEETGIEAHYYAYGKTSYGFDWNYDTDNSNFVIRCDYNFDQQQYDFSFYGVTPGTAHVTLYYNISDKVQAPVQLTVNVDDGLNVSIA